jgi:hypothetical protein
VDPVPDPRLLRKSGSAGNQTWDIEKNYDILLEIFYIFAHLREFQNE